MVPIKINNNEFRERIAVENEIFRICTKHRLHGKARIFCLLLFDVNDGNIFRVIDDSNYWNSLNVISGENLSVIYLPTHYSNANRKKFNNSIEELFEIENRDKRSIIILFQLNVNNEIIDYYQYNIRTKTFEDKYEEIKNLFEWIGDSFNYIIKENERNYQELFDLAEQNIKTYVKIGILRKVLKGVINIASIIAAIKTFIPM
jgi:hypothetical protein